MISLTRLLGLTMMLGAAAPVWGQFDAATVLGAVRDRNAGAIQGAVVQLQNMSTGLNLSAPTGAEGEFQFINVPIGRYVLTVEQTGFQAARSAEFELRVNARQRVDFTLEVAAVETAVQVTGEVALVEADSSERGQVVNARQIVELPLNGRRYSQLILLATGTTPSPSNETTGSSSREGAFIANGLRSTFNNFLLDGLDNNYFGTSNQGFSAQTVQPTPDAVAEFKVVTNNMSAEFGRSGGATVNAAMRSGTNEFHGSAWEYFRNTQLNAVGFFRPLGGKPTLNRNQFGFTFGGPVVQNRTFFFANYEGFREVSALVNFATLPTEAQRNGIIGLPVLNPLTQRVYAGVIPASDMIPFARQVLELLPPTTNASPVNNYQVLRRISDYRDKGDLKVDQIFSEGVRGFMRYSQSRANIFDPGVIPGVAGGDGNGFTRIPITQIAGGLTWSMSPVSILEARFGFSRSRAGKDPVLTGGPSMRELFGITGLPEDPRYTGGITYQGFLGGLTSLGRQWTNPQYQYPTLWNPKVNYSRIAGSHTIKTGFEYQAVNVEQLDIHPVYGIDAYAGLFTGRFLPTFNPGDARQVLSYSYTDFLFGLRAQILQANPTVAHVRQRFWSGYLQDDIRVNRSLTLNLGLRYEFGSPLFERDNRLSNWDPVSNAMALASSGSLRNRALVNPDRNNFAPRLGFAWSPARRTAVRGGYGVSFVHWNRVGSSYLSLNAPFAIIAQRLTIPGTPLYRNTQDGYPQGLVDPARYNPLEATHQHMPEESPSGRVQSWFFSVQRELPGEWLVDLAYVGNRGNHLIVINDLNQARPNAPGQALPVQARRPNQRFSSIVGTMPWAYSNYHGLQAKVEKRYGSGLYFLNSFTWSKTIDLTSQPLDGGAIGNDVPSVQDINNIGADRGLSAYDRPLVNATSLVWDMPFLKANRLLGGWQLMAINQMRSGPTLTFIYNPSAAQEVSPLITVFGRNMYRADVSGNPVAANRTHDMYFNRSNLFIPPADRPFGNSGRNIARGFAFFQLDLGLAKTFRINERINLQFRAESFNALNRTNFRAPNTDVSSVAFGTIRSAFDPRQFQLALRLQF